MNIYLNFVWGGRNYGMINKDGLLTVKVNKDYGQSTVAKILDLVENASAKKASTEKFITKFARYYTPVVVYAALTISILPPLFLPGAAFSDWIYRALIFLVISCPCALVVSIPLGFFGGIGRASRQGILVKGGNYLEALNNVTQIVFDKTGTLTKGEFAVSKIEVCNNFDEQEILSCAAYAESHSTHPIAKSILDAYDIKYNQEIDNNGIENYQEISGCGIKAVVDGKEVLAGNNKLMDKNKIDYQQVDENGTIIYLAIDNKYAGYITITDKLKKDSVEAIKGLKLIGINKLVMLTGDREGVSQRVVRQLGLDKYYAELLPDQKVEKIEELLNEEDEDEIATMWEVVFADVGVALLAILNVMRINRNI